MLRRLYIHNYKCFQNFAFEPNLAFKPDSIRSTLLIGKNGSGKTALMEVLGIFQAIGRGEHRVSNIFNKDTLTIWRETDHCIFEINAHIAGREYLYSITLELPINFTTARVRNEKLTIDGNVSIDRELGLVSLNKKAEFPIDWHLFALPIIQSREENTAIMDFKHWLANMLLLSPVPKLMRDISTEETSYMNIDCENFIDYFREQRNDSLIAAELEKNIKIFIEDFSHAKLAQISEKERQLDIYFDKKNHIRFCQLSEGEKKFILHAVVLAAFTANSNNFVFWDEPDNYLANAEIQTFVSLLRQHANAYGQMIITSHNIQTASCFSKESTFLMTRRSHINPSEILYIPESEDFFSVVEELEVQYV